MAPQDDHERRLRDLERALDALSNWTAQGFAHMREDVHKSVAWIGVEFYDLRPAISRIVERLEAIDRRTAALEQHAATEAEERPARQQELDGKLKEITDKQDRRWRFEKWAWGILAGAIVLGVGIWIGVVAVRYIAGW